MDDKPRPRFGRVPDAKRESGLSRAKLYLMAAEHPGLFKKADRATIVDLEYLREILAGLPAADISRRHEPVEAP